MSGYLTPDTLPADTICRVLFIPNNEEFIANVTGALQQLTFDWNWTKYGSLTPEQAAEAMVPMFDRFCFNEGVCRMVGELVLWAGTGAPNADNLLLCDGSHVSNVDYPDLWNIIGTTYGGTGETDFALPDLQGKVAIGENGSHALGSAGGSETVTLTTAEMPSHAHTDLGHSHSEITATPSVAELPVVPVPAAVPGIGVTGIGAANIQASGGGNAHNNMQPYLTLKYYIVAA